MGRRKKNDSSVLVGVVNDFYADEAGGDPGKLKYSALAKYAQSKGVAAKWYDFQRDEAVARRIQELREWPEPEENQPVVPAYKSLDIEELLRNCRTAEELKRKLHELDGYWKKAYESAAEWMEQNRKLSGKAIRVEAEVRRLEREKADLEAALGAEKSRTKRLREETAYLRRTLREYLYPAVADELLGSANPSDAKNETVRPDAFPKLIEGAAPQPFDGVQQPLPKETDRQERLLDAMRKQARNHGK